MRCIIAGSRKATQAQLEAAIYQCAFYPEISVVFSGMHPAGGDHWGVLWAKRWQIPIRPFPAQWQNLNPYPLYKIQPLIVQRGKRTYDKTAGIRRNEHMAMTADALIFAMVDNSYGTTDMLNRAITHKLQIFGLKFDRKGELCQMIER